MLCARQAYATIRFMSRSITNPQTRELIRYVFVYGTLRRGQVRDVNRLRPTPLFIGNGQVKGTLYDLDSYPGLCLKGEQQVQGEVYQITPELEQQLDEIEEVWPKQSGEYAKRDTRLNCEGVELTCLVYEVSDARSQGCSVIESGDWVAHSRLS